MRRLPSGRWQARYPDRATSRMIAGPGTFDTRSEALAWLDTRRAALTDPRHLAVQVALASVLPDLPAKRLAAAAAAALAEATRPV